MSDERAPIPYCRHHTGEEEIAAIVETLRGGWIARGPRAREFEARVAERVGASHAISCANGSVALEIALRGLGIGPGDDVIVPSLTWVATAMAVVLVGARPVFADVSPQTLCLSPEAASARWTPRTRAVIAVDFAGRPHEAAAMRALVRSHGASLIADGAHAFGAAHPDGRAVGGDGTADLTTFSFHPAKTLTTAEGGIITTADADVAARMARIRSGGITRDFPGSRGRYDFLATEVGSNHHLSELHAVLGLVQLGRLDDFLALRRSRWEGLLARLQPLADRLILPAHPAGSCHNLFIVQLTGDRGDSSRRDAILARLRARGVLAHMHYPLLHRQPIFLRDAQGLDALLPASVNYSRRAITLPLFPHLTDHELDRVAAETAAALDAALPVSS